MVICERYNFLFLRIPKNASSSLAQFFVENFCNKNDIYTEINDCGVSNNNVNHNVISKYKKHHRFIHLKLQEIVDENIISRESVFKKDVISILRNPLERQLSLYFFLKRNKETSVEEFRSLFSQGKHPTDPSNVFLQTEYPMLDGKDLGTWWLYENIDHHKDQFLLKHSINKNVELKKFKSNFKPKKLGIVEEFYDRKTTDAVKKYYEKDFEKYYELTGKSI